MDMLYYSTVCWQADSLQEELGMASLSARTR